MSTRPGTPAHAVAGLLGVRSSHGRYYGGYRHSTSDLQRTLGAVNAVSWVLADASGDAGYLVDGTLPVIGELLGAQAVALVSHHPGLGGVRTWERAPRAAADLVRRAAELVADCPPTGVVRVVPDLSCTLLLAPMPHPGGRAGHVVAAVPFEAAVDGTDLAILGTLTNQVSGAIESCRRLAESERLRAAAALRDAAEQAAAVVRRRPGERGAGSAISFTARESEVVRLLAHGRSNRQIGQQLFISETTVKFHVHNVMAKLGVRRRAEVVYRSGQLGLLPM